MMERDPRVDPRPGDVLEKPRRKCGGKLQRKVIRSGRRKDASVRFGEIMPGEKYGDFKGASLAVWQAWAKTATILKRGV
jgi:hypothetical protein